MNAFTWFVLAVLALVTVIQLWLARRHVRHVQRHRDSVPEAFRDAVDASAHHKAAAYTIAKTRAAMADTLIAAALFVLWTLGGALEGLDGLWHATGLSPLVAGTGFVVSFLALSSVLELPMDVYRTFGIERRFGFSRMSAGLFIADNFKQLLLTLAIATPLVWVVLWLMADAGPLWWLAAWVVWMGFSVLMLWAYPVVIAPLFNRFLPLDNPELRQRIERLLARCGFASKGIFVMDGSRRSSHGNAYFTGLGENKRIVFFDTLLNSLDAVEIEAVLAHELGHFKRHHVAKRLMSMSALSLLALGALGWLSGQPWFYAGLGMSQSSTHAALVLFLLIAPLAGFFIQPALAAGMRRHEFEADDFAAEQTDPSTLVRALVKLYEDNANTLTPDPLYSAFHDSHPPAPVRVAHLLTKIPG